MTTYQFAPPWVEDRPRFLPDGAYANKLFKFYKPGKRGVNVYQLADGTFVQDTPTAENSNAGVPYPIGSPGNIVATSWLNGQATTTVVPNPVVQTYYGGHIYTISQAVYNQLLAAGYADCLSSF